MDSSPHIETATAPQDRQPYAGELRWSDRSLQLLFDRACEIFEMQVMRGSLGLIDAIDLVYSAAVSAGIVARVGDDLVQGVMTAAITEATKRLNRSEPQ